MSQSPRAYTPWRTYRNNQLLPGVCRPKGIKAPKYIREILGEDLERIIYADHPKQWPGLLKWVGHRLRFGSTLETEHLFGPLYVLRILVEKHEKEGTPFVDMVEETFPSLLKIFYSLVRIDNISIELEIPRQFVDSKWMVLFLEILERTFPSAYPDTSVWLRVKELTVDILNYLNTRFEEDLEPDKLATVQENILKHYLNLLMAIVFEERNLKSQDLRNRILRGICSISENNNYNHQLPHVPRCVQYGNKFERT